MKKLLLISAVIALLIVGCANKDINPLSPATSITGADGNPVEFDPWNDITGQLMEEADSVGVDPEDEASWIYIHFEDVMDITSTGVKVEEADGDPVAYTMEWTVSGGQTDLLLKPEDNLDYNTTYYLRIIGAELSDIRGNLLDQDFDWFWWVFDPDGVGGETPDDDFGYAFATFKSDGSDGDDPVSLDDVYGPWVSSSIYFLLSGTPTGYIWTDVDIAIDIRNYSLRKSDTTWVVVGADESTIDATTAMLLETNSGEVVELSDVDYDDDTTSTEFSRLVLKPNANLKPGTTYTLRLLGAIADDVGIKLDEGNYVAYEEDFTTRCCTHDSSEIADDIEPPYVVGWYALNSHFEVEFSEILDPATITLSTVYLSGETGVLSVRTEAGHTFVRFTTSDGSSVSGWAYATAELKDLAGNRKGSTSSHSF